MFGLNTKFISDYERSWENLRDDTGAFNQRGLEYTLEAKAINNEKALSFIKVAVNDLGGHNTRLSHAGADILLQNIHSLLLALDSTEKFKVFRVGADFVLIFDQSISKNELKELKIKIEDQFKSVFVENKEVKFNLSAFASKTELSARQLPVVYKMIEHVKPAKGFAHAVQDVMKNFGEVELDPDEKVLDVVPRNINNHDNLPWSSQDYREKIMASINRLRSGVNYEDIEKDILNSINRFIEGDHLLKNIESISYIDYNMNFRSIRNRVAIMGSRTVVFPLKNVHGAIVGGLEINLKNDLVMSSEFQNDNRNVISDAIDYKGKMVKVWRFPGADRVDKGGADLVYINNFIHSKVFVQTAWQLIDMRRYSPAISLLDPGGRSPFFGRAVEPFLEQLRVGLVDENLPEIKVIRHILEKDKFLVIRRGGEEFYIYFPLSDGRVAGLSFDYNKFSRHSISWGEGAGDKYMERTAGLLRHHLVDLIKQSEAAGKSFSTYQEISDLFLEAVNLVDNDFIDYEMPNKDHELKDKQGRNIYILQDNLGKDVLIATKNNQEIEIIMKGKQLSGVPEQLTMFKLLSRFGNNAPELRRTHPRDGRLRYNLNRLIGVNPKAVYRLGDNSQNGKIIIEGKADQQLLKGLSLAAGLEYLTPGNTVHENILATDARAGKQKDRIDNLLVIDNHQISVINYESGVKK